MNQQAPLTPMGLTSNDMHHGSAPRTTAPAVDIGTLFEKHWGTATRIARTYVSDRAAAEDVASEAVLKVAEALESGGGPSDNPAGYLCTTVRNLALRHVCRQRTHAPIDAASDVATPVADPDDVDALRAALASLPDRWRSILWATEVEGRTPTDIAETWRTSPNAVAALSYRARNALREAFGNAVSGDRAPAA